MRRLRLPSIRRAMRRPRGNQRPHLLPHLHLQLLLHWSYLIAERRGQRRERQCRHESHPPPTTVQNTHLREKGHDYRPNKPSRPNGRAWRARLVLQSDGEWNEFTFFYGMLLYLSTCNPLRLTYEGHIGLCTSLLPDSVNIIRSRRSSRRAVVQPRFGNRRQL